MTPNAPKRNDEPLQTSSQRRELRIVKRLQAIAQAGLTYGESKYDLERYEELRALAVELAAIYGDAEPAKARGIFANETGYQTPKLDVRAVCFREGKLLMTREEVDGKWTPPGGWADVGYSPFEIAVKEAREESGFVVEPKRLLAVLDKEKHAHPPSIHHTLKLFVLCEIVGGEAETGTETTGVGFFAEDDLPPLSEDRITPEQIALLFEFYRNPGKPTVCD